MARHECPVRWLWLTFMLTATLAVPTYSATVSNSEYQGTSAVVVNATKVVHVTDPRFLSLGMDSNLIRNRWETFDVSSVRLQTLAKGLSPAYLRLSGTDADRMIFDPKQVAPPLGSSRRSPEVRSNDLKEGAYRRLEPRGMMSPEGTLFPPTNFTMTAGDWRSINRFAADVGWRIVFGLNAQLRRGADWDPTNAIQLLQYSIREGFAANLDFELGNEPDLYPVGKAFSVLSPQQLARDFKELRKLLDGQFGAYFRKAILVGPDIATAYSGQYMTQFLDHVGHDVIAAAAFHQYYGGGELKYLANFTDPHVLDFYIPEVQAVRMAVRDSAEHKMKVWQGETSSTYAPPGSDICQSYAAVFMLVDKLGLSARMGVDLVVRQTFYGFWFALVDERFNARPTYWTTLLYRNLVGSRVLNISVTAGEKMADRKLRGYAHCTSSRASAFVKGAVTVYMMNLSDRDQPLTFERMGNTAVEYLLTSYGSRGLLSASLSLNGSPVVMTSESRLPPLEGRTVALRHPIVLPAKTLAFYVLSRANASACM